MSKVVAMIPIKLNNQRLPGKNLKMLGDKVLCQYLFETALQVKNIDEIYVYCSSEEIKKYLPQGIKFLKREKKLDQDDVKSAEIIDSFVKQIDADIYVLMHVTQPFILASTIQEAVSHVLCEEYDSAFVAHEIKEFAWYNGRPINYSFDNVVRTQELMPIYTEGELFVFEKSVFVKDRRRIGTNPWIQPIDWKENVCIDTQEDFCLANAVLLLEKENYKNGKGRLLLKQ